MTSNKRVFFNFLVSVFRWYLAFYLFSYGVQKLLMNQFIVTDTNILNKSIKDIDSFYIAWYLYEKSSFFSIVTGVLEIVASVFLIFNRTLLIGSLLALVILSNILIIDISFTTGLHGYTLVFRVIGMLFCNIFILTSKKDDIKKIWKVLTIKNTDYIKYSWWVYPILLILGFLLDFVFVGLFFLIKKLVPLF